MTELVFTYGTLMEKQKAHGLFEMHLFADGILRDYGLYEVGGFPAAVPVEGFNVYGEIYEVDNDVLLEMDRYESEGSLYIRRLLEIEVGPKKFDAWVYEYNRDVSNLELRAPIGKWTPKRKPVSDYAWYVCYGSNLLRERFDDYLRRTNAIVYAEKSYMLDGEIYFAKHSSRWDNKGVCFLDLSKKDKKSYGWAYLVDKDKIDAITKEEGGSWYPKQNVGFDKYGIEAYTVTGLERYSETEPGMDYLTIIAAGLRERFDLSQNEIRRYLNCNARIHFDENWVEGILKTYCS